RLAPTSTAVPPRGSSFCNSASSGSPVRTSPAPIGPVNQHCRLAKACPSLCLPTATPRLSVGGGRRERGCSPVVAVSGGSKGTSSSAPALREAPTKASLSRCPRTVTLPSWAGPGDNPGGRLVPFGLGAAGAAWIFTRSGGVWTQEGDKPTALLAVPVRASLSHCPLTATP